MNNIVFILYDILDFYKYKFLTTSKKVIDLFIYDFTLCDFIILIISEENFQRRGNIYGS